MALPGALGTDRLRRRAEFLAVGRGTRTVRQGFVLQGLLARDQNSLRPPRFGFTVTKKIGNAVVRNRIRRRLRAVVRSAALHAAAGGDYVLVARETALTLPFERLIADLESGLGALAQPKGRTTGRMDG